MYTTFCLGDVYKQAKYNGSKRARWNCSSIALKHYATQRRTSTFFDQGVDFLHYFDLDLDLQRGICRKPNKAVRMLRSCGH